jgi:hypothetical protein
MCRLLHADGLAREIPGTNAAISCANAAPIALLIIAYQYPYTTQQANAMHC